MTEYSSSPEAVRDFMNSRERTAVWVRTHTPTRDEFYSPSLPPSVLPPTPTSPPSEVESSHSVPPRMFLKYGDGRPDVPIPNSRRYDGGSHSTRSSGKRHDWDSAQHQQHHHHHHNYSRPHPPIPPPPPHGHERSRSYSIGNTTEPDRLGRSGSRRVDRPHEVRPLTPLSPEEIRIWPSDSDDIPTPLIPRSKSLPRNTYFHDDDPPPLPTSSAYTRPLQAMFPPPPRHTPRPISPPRNHHTPTPRAIAHPQPRPAAWHSVPNPPLPKPSSRAPPAIVYAPSHHSRTNFSPPPIVPAYAHAHQTVGGMKYSHSAPVRYEHGSHDRRRVMTPLSSVESRSSSSHSRPSSRNSGRDSDDSGSTYYVLPTPGQKVHIIAPEGSIYTATSTTRSPSSPSSKKPFFHRLFEKLSIADSSRPPSTSGRRLQRRHSTDARKPQEQRAQ